MKNFVLILACALFAVPVVAEETLATRKLSVAGEGSVALQFPAA